MKRSAFFVTIMFMFVLVLLAGCDGSGDVTPPPRPTHPPTEADLATKTAAQPTPTQTPTQAPPVPLTAQPAPAIQPTAKVVTTSAGTVPPLKGDVPGLLNKPLEQPGAWEQKQDLMTGLPGFAWKCDSAEMKSRFRPAQEALDLVKLLGDQAALDKAVAELKGKGFTVLVSKPLVFSQALADLPFEQLTDCKVQKALALFGSIPDNLPADVGLISAQRAGQVEGKPAFERVWILVWK